MDPKHFTLDAAERAAKTFAQALLGFYTAGSLVTHVDWKEALIVALSAALYSVLSSVASLPVGDGSASIVKAPVLTLVKNEAPAPAEQPGQHEAEVA